ncbi:MAG: hypothetical protein V2B14_00635 [bacterium]
MFSNLDIIFFRSALIISIGKAKLSQETNIFRKAFILAEVLIVLIVVGVIGGITIPTVYHNIRDAQDKTAFVSTYSVMDQASKMILMDNAGSLKGVFTSIDNMKNIFSIYLNYNKSCDHNA